MGHGDLAGLWYTRSAADDRLLGCRVVDRSHRPSRHRLPILVEHPRCGIDPGELDLFVVVEPRKDARHRAG